MCEDPMARTTHYHARLVKAIRHRPDARPRLHEPENAPVLRARHGAQPAVPDGDGAAPRHETRAGRPWLFAAGGAAATAIPAAPGFAMAAAGHPQAIPLLISSGVIGLVSVIAGTVVKVHDITQRTRRLQIQHEGAIAIAKAMARCLDDAHAAAADLPPDLGAAEAASVRATAMQTVTEMMPAILAVVGQQNPDCGDVGTVHPVGSSRLELPGNSGETA
jgi:hypothetical protein